MHNNSALTGKVMSDYKIRVGRQEFNTKCSYDAVQGFEHLLSLADNLGIDVHSIAFTGGSAGGGEINYLTYVYHSFFSPPKYSPRSMVRCIQLATKVRRCTGYCGDAYQEISNSLPFRQIFYIYFWFCH